MSDKQTPLSRHQYKAVWSGLSNSWDSAKRHVIGDVSEDVIQRQAYHSVERLKQTIGIEPSHRVLEIGCGFGRMAPVLAPVCREWVGLDVSRQMLEFGRQRLADTVNVSFVEGNGFDLAELDDATFDRVYCVVVFMHLDEWERWAYTREAFRLLKPGGRFFVNNFSLAHPDGWEFFLKNSQIPPHERPAHISKHSTPDELRIFFEKAGFTGIRQQHSALWIETWGTKPDVRTMPMENPIG